MPNETPKQSLRDQWEQEADGHKPTETIYPPTKEQIAKQCTCGLQAHPQPNCPAAKQPDEMPDVIYLNRGDVKYLQAHIQRVVESGEISYIRKSIHDEEITKLKLALKECVEDLEVFQMANFCKDKMNDHITSAKGLYE